MPPPSLFTAPYSTQNASPASLHLYNPTHPVCRAQKSLVSNQERLRQHLLNSVYGVEIHRLPLNDWKISPWLCIPVIFE